MSLVRYWIERRSPAPTWAASRAGVPSSYSFTGFLVASSPPFWPEPWHLHQLTQNWKSYLQTNLGPPIMSGPISLSISDSWTLSSAKSAPPSCPSAFWRSQSWSSYSFWIYPDPSKIMKMTVFGPFFQFFQNWLFWIYPAWIWAVVLWYGIGPIWLFIFYVFAGPHICSVDPRIAGVSGCSSVAGVLVLFSGITGILVVVHIDSAAQLALVPRLLLPFSGLFGLEVCWNHFLGLSDFAAIIFCWAGHHLSPADTIRAIPGICISICNHFGLRYHSNLFGKKRRPQQWILSVLLQHYSRTPLTVMFSASCLCQSNSIFSFFRPFSEYFGASADFGVTIWALMRHCKSLRGQDLPASHPEPGAHFLKTTRRSWAPNRSRPAKLLKIRQSSSDFDFMAWERLIGLAEGWTVLTGQFWRRTFLSFYVKRV